ncbi:MAG TPA: phytanoyl-CoA dioxygenase family protein, partial [bacterium]|nr:phytanoyl-CoA dioxygenase family protein [bacterium]
YGGVFLELLENEVMHQMFEAFLGNSCILYNFGSTIMPPHGATMASKIHIDTPRFIPGYHAGLIMTLALDDFTQENGGTYYLPGSQHLSDPPDEELFELRKVSVARPKGSAVFFNPRTYHRGGFNATDALRAGVTVYAVRSFMKPRFEYTKMIPDAVAETLSERSRKFLGYHSRVPSKMEEFYVLPENRLYKAGQG